MSDEFNDFDGLLESASATGAAPAEPTEQIDAMITSVPITIQIDQKALLNSWLAGKHYEETDGHIADAVIGQVSAIVAHELLPTIKTAVLDSVKSNVETIVTERLAEGVAEVDRWGSQKGPSIPLREMIGKAVDDALRKPMGSSSRAQKTLIQETVAAEVGAAFKAELKTAVAEARALATKAVEQAAGEVIAETIERARKGLST